MKNNVIFNLVQGGVLTATAHTVSAQAAYALYKLKKNLTKAYEDLDEKRQELIKQADIQDLINKENLTDEEKERLLKADGMVRELFDDETEVQVTPVSYDDWHKLQIENASDKKDIFNYDAESALENIFWKAPED